jgi:hypothetical protein
MQPGDALEQALDRTRDRQVQLEALLEWDDPASLNRVRISLPSGAWARSVSVALQCSSDIEHETSLTTSLLDSSKRGKSINGNNFPDRSSRAYLVVS